MNYKLIENLRILRKRKGWNQAEMAKQLDIKVSTYGKIERGIIKLNVDRLYALTELLGTTTEHLLHGKEERDIVSLEDMNQDIKKTNVTYIPVNAQAGALREIEQSTFCERIYIPNISESNLFMIHVEGDSMTPTISNGDLILLKKQDAPSIHWGNVYVVDTLDGLAVKRIFQHTKHKSKYILVSDNEVYPPYEVALNDIKAIWRVTGYLSKNLSPKSLRSLQSL